MGDKTFKRRQKEANRLKQQKKAARLKERRNERSISGTQCQQQEPGTAGPNSQAGPKGRPVYFSCATTPRVFKRTSEIILHKAKNQ